MNRRPRILLMCFAGLALMNFNLSPVSAQLGGGTGGTGGGLEGEIIDAVNAGGGVGGGGAGGTGGTGNTAGTGGNAAGEADTGPNLEDLANVLGSQDVEIVTPPNERDQPFVGISPSSSEMDGINEFRHVGALGEFVGNRGTNATGGSQGGFGPAGSGGGLGPGGLGGGLGGSSSGFTVPRTQSSVRSRIVPGFRLTPLPSNLVASRFNRRVAALPATRQMAGQVNVSMQGRTAVITGAANAQQVDRIQRQLRLEPGVSRIVNQVRVSQ